MVLLTAGDVAKRWQISVRTLERMRAEHEGPRYVKIGASVRYRIEDIEDFEGDHVQVWQEAG